MLGQHRLR